MLQQWSIKWQLKFCAKKYKVMHFGSRNTKTEYTMDRMTLATITIIKEKDLWILIDD